MDKCLVILSGGQDSTTCLYWALKNFKVVEAIHFDYGQKNELVELSKVIFICSKVGVRLKTIKLYLNDIVESDLFKGGEFSVKDNIPSSFVPFRNLFFLTYAMAYAYTREIQNIVIGVNQVDFSGYPDCRKDFILSAEKTLRLAIDKEVNIITPLLEKSKVEIFELADDLNCLDVIINDTITCYNGNLTINEWGLGCGECPACKIRKQSYQDYLTLKKPSEL